MTHRSRTAVVLPTLLALAFPAAGCGGADDPAPDAAGAAGAASASEASSAPSEAGPMLQVTITRSDGSDAGPFIVSDANRGARDPSVTRVGDFTSVAAIFGDDAPASTATLKTRAPAPTTVRLDDEGETADALRLLFAFRGEPGSGAMEGQYESMDGEVTITALTDARIAGIFDGTFERQHDDTSHRVRGSFDFRRAP